MHTRQQLALVVLGSLIAAISGCGSYHPAEYSGDGTMYALPQATPRYDLELEPMSLTRSGRAEFQLSDLPADNLLAMFCVNDPTPEKLEAIEKAGVHVGMTLVDREAARTSTKQGLLLADWSPTPESWNETPADFEGIWFRPTRHSRYVLTVDITVDHPLADPTIINATPHVRGGGFGTH